MDTRKDDDLIKDNPDLKIDPKACFYQNIHPHNFSIFGRSNQNIAWNAQQIQANEEAKDQLSSDSCGATLLGYVKSFFGR